MRALGAPTTIAAAVVAVSMLEVTFARRLALFLVGPILGVALFAGVSSSSQTTLATAVPSPIPTVRAAAVQPLVAGADSAAVILDTRPELFDAHEDGSEVVRTVDRPDPLAEHAHHGDATENGPEAEVGPAVVVERAWPQPAEPIEVRIAPTPRPTPIAPTATPVPPTPAPTAAPTPVQVEVPPAAAPATLQQRGQEALGYLSYDWQGRLGGWRIDFLPARSGYRGLTFTAESRIEIYVRDGDDAWTIARVIAHELGHAVDVMLNDAGDRSAWLNARGIPGALWWPGSGVSDFGSGAGDFAECFATWQVGSGSLSTLAGGCTADQLNLMAQLS